MMGVRDIITIVMDQQKSLKVKVTGALHQFESNADEIIVLLPCNCGGISLSKCEITIHYSSSQIKEGKIFFDDTPTQYNESYLQYKCHVPAEMTLVGGKLPIWIECINAPENTRIVSDKSYLDIVETLKFDNESLASITPVLGQWFVKMTQTYNHADEILMQAMEQANTATKAASLILEVLNEIKEGGK